MNIPISSVYFITKPHFIEAMMTFSFRRSVNWIEEGMVLLSWEYKKVFETPEKDVEMVYKVAKSWDGNKYSREAGHRSISVGDIVLSGSIPYLVIGGGWVVVPQEIWKRIKKTH